MIKTELICSKKYTLKVNNSLTNEQWFNLVFLSKKFEPIYLKNTPLILEKIPYYTGLNWNPDLYLQIYIADYSGPSRTNPLTIKIDSDENMLVKLIHELTHINFPNKLKKLEENLYEDAINQVSEKITRELNIKDCEALRKISTYRNELRDKSFSVDEIPFDSINLKNYFSILN